MANNKGEWAEFYTFLKLIEDRKVSAADSQLNIIPGNYYFIHKIHREESGVNKVFDLESNSVVNVDFFRDGNAVDKFSVLRRDLHGKSAEILSEMQTQSGVFEIDFAQKLLKDLGLDSLKSPSKNKADIELEINDKVTNQSNKAGFSIKSYFAGRPTLLNAGKNTRFRFNIRNFTPDLNAINEDNFPSIGKHKRKIETIESGGGKLEFVGLAPSPRSTGIFERNLKKLELELPKMLSAMLYTFYTTDKVSKLSDLARLVLDNRQNFSLHPDLDEEMFEIKLKHMLINSALGMVAGEEWDARIKVDGGYIIVRSDGELVCFHVYNYSDLADYLYENTQFETPDSKPAKSDFGRVLEIDSDYFFDLALQIRFLVTK